MLKTQNITECFCLFFNDWLKSCILNLMRIWYLPWRRHFIRPLCHRHVTHVTILRWTLKSASVKPVTSWSNLALIAHRQHLLQSSLHCHRLNNFVLLFPSLLLFIICSWIWRLPLHKNFESKSYRLTAAACVFTSVHLEAPTFDFT